jgi:hypothetical protein
LNKSLGIFHQPSWQNPPTTARISDILGTVAHSTVNDF